MEATATIVVLLFVLTIFSTIKDGSFQKPGKPPVSQTIQIESTRNIPPTYTASFDSNTQDAILRYVKLHAKKISADDISLLSDSLMKYGKQYDINPKLVAALIDRESSFNPSSVSSSNAQGLAQLLPSTAAHIGISNMQDIDEGTKGASLYLRMMLDRWVGYPNQVELALASYTEGSNQIMRAGGAYTASTAGYIKDIAQNYFSIN